MITNEDFANAVSSAERDRLCLQVVEDLIELAERFDWSLIMVYAPFAGEDHLKVISELRRRVGGEFMIGSWVAGGVLNIPTGKTMEEFCYRIVDEPEKINAEAEIILENANRWGQRCVDAGSELLILANDVAFNQGSFLSPPLFSEFITPYLRRHVERLKRLGAWVVFHSDGNLSAVMDQIVSSGIHGLNPIDAMAGMDIAEVKRLYGDKIALFGNVRCDLVHKGTVEEVRESARYCLENAKKGGGLVYTCSSEIFVDSPWENCLELESAWRKWGRYGNAMAS
ncbi:MAG: hypothetical protein JW808_01070 [Victivallales bacterium]|nr:hypothetical protein [Victivallales bacterium]